MSGHGTPTCAAHGHTSPVIESRNPGHVDDVLDLINKRKPHGAIERVSERYNLNRTTIEDLVGNQRRSRATALIVTLELLGEIDRVHPEHADEVLRKILAPFGRGLAPVGDSPTSSPTSLALRAMSDVGKATSALDEALSDGVLTGTEASQIDAAAAAAIRNLEALRRAVREKAGLS